MRIESGLAKVTVKVPRFADGVVGRLAPAVWISRGLKTETTARGSPPAPRAWMTTSRLASTVELGVPWAREETDLVAVLGGFEGGHQQ